MKKICVCVALFVSQIFQAQTNVDQLLELGIENAQQFSTDYFAPAGEALINSMSNGWYSTAKVKKLFHFEIGFIGNVSFIREEKQSFILNTIEYTDVSLQNSASNQSVASIFGTNEEDIVVILNQGQAGSIQVTLPDGIGDKAIKMIPTGFLQGSMGISKSTEIKARFLPKIKSGEEAEVSLFGLAVQHELTDWMYSWKRLPFRVSGLIGYTRIKGFYDFSDDSVIDGEDQEIDLKSNSWLISGIISTKLPKLNFYGGFGYYFGSSKTDILGTYRLQNGPLVSQTIKDPISVENKTRGLKATLGTNVQLGFFRVNLDYTLQNYSNLSLGLNFGW